MSITNTISPSVRGGKKVSYITSIESLGIEEGLQQGRKKERYEMAKNLLSEGFPLDLVKKVTKLSDLDLAELEKA
jgi:predicted transposase/invertase (TIGR01784 family)